MSSYAINKKAHFDYEILQKFEAGIILSGQEVKSVRNGQASLKSAFVTLHNNDAYLTNASISKYKFAGDVKDYELTKSRKILLKSKEINYLRAKINEKGLTIVPISLYNKGRYIKLEIALVKGKKKFDKRETIKKRETQREVRRTLKRG